MTFDSYLLWNRHNVEQLRRDIREAAEREVKIAGSPQFDFYWKPEYIWSEGSGVEGWAFPPIGPSFYLRVDISRVPRTSHNSWATLTTRSNGIEIPGKPIILFRRHPVDPLERWQGVLRTRETHRDGQSLATRRQSSGSYKLGMQDICKLASTLYYASVHVNVASTMAMDGAIFDKPQVGPAYDESPSRKYHRCRDTNAISRNISFRLRNREACRS